MYSMLEIVCVIGIFYGLWKLGKLLEDLRDGLIHIDKRLTKLEKDAVKITFTHPPYTTDDVLDENKIKNK